MRLSMLLSGLAVLASPALAEVVVVVADPVPTIRVSYADLNLGTQSGVDRMRTRINSAAGTLCLTNDVEPVKIRSARKACFNHAKADGYSKLDRLLAERQNGTAIAAATLTISAR